MQTTQPTPRMKVQPIASKEPFTGAWSGCNRRDANNGRHVLTKRCCVCFKKQNKLTLSHKPSFTAECFQARGGNYWKSNVGFKIILLNGLKTQTGFEAIFPSQSC